MTGRQWFRNIGARAFGACASVVLAIALGAASVVACPAGSWRVTAIDGESVTGAGQLTFERDRLSGRAACNRVHATLTRGDGSLRIGPIATTRMGCSKGMDLEARLIASLATVEKTAVVEGRCVLRDGTGRDRVTFVRAGQ
jgi:heat shock protein HslJ